MTTRKTREPARAQGTRQVGPGTRGYPSDLTHAQWQVIAAHLPAERPGRRGRPRVWPFQRIVEAILYLDRTGCAWRYLPADFPPWQTVYGYFATWRDDGTLARLHAELRARARAAAGRDPQPTAAVIDSQSVRAADTVPRTSRGWDNAKKVNGRKRHIAVDATGLVLDVVITAASVQDRQAARPMLWNTHRACRRVRLIWADAGYTGTLATWAARLKMTLQIVAKRDPHAFEVLPRRWVVERTFAWISKHRRTVRDYEHLPASHEAMILWAMIALMTRRLAQPTHLSDTHLQQVGQLGLALAEPLHRSLASGLRGTSTLVSGGVRPASLHAREWRSEHHPDDEGRAAMSDQVRVWTTVGSAGALTATDLAKVTLHNAVIALGHDIVTPAASAPDDSSAVPPITAIVRYNITPVDGLFPASATFPPFHYRLQLCYRGTVRARLVQVSLPNGAEHDLLHFDSGDFPPAHSFVTQSTNESLSSVMDFVNFAYYVEATLIASAIVAGNPAEIAVIKVGHKLQP